ncbi:Sensor histidine kinase [hydrothermal vent metagenome]|uniref:histidine kinase n=1 Tax=hydrothermal vent metagenome TaxID=652676 RepID=A0A3B0UM29_9ZZZZ
MKNLLPDSIAARATLLLVVGLAVTHLVSNLFYETDRESALLTAGGREAIQWVSTTGAFADTVSPDTWSKIIKADNYNNLFVTITPEPVINKTQGTDWREIVLHRELVRRVEPERVDDYRIAYAPSHVNTQAMSYWRPIMSKSEKPAPKELILISLRLNSGKWLNVATPIQSPPLFFSLRLWLSMGVMLVAVTLISIFTVRRMTAPLKQLSQAAEKLGTDVQAPAIPETGPEEVRRTAHAFNVMQNRIRRFVEDRIQMLGAIAHDLGTPITRLRLRAEFVEDDELRFKMLRDLDDMQHMVASTLSFIREDATAEPQTRVDLGSLLARVCDDIKDAGANVKLAEIPRWVLLDCHPIALRRALGNLIGNAVKYGNCALVSLKLEENRVLVFIDDKGPGIPPERQEEVFLPFLRLEDSRNRATGGAGLGLAVARNIVRAHGGDIRLSNRALGGLRVELDLPRPSRPEEKTTRHPDREDAGGKTGKDASGAASNPVPDNGADNNFKSKNFTPRNNSNSDFHPVVMGRDLPIQSGLETCLSKGRMTEWKTH